VDGATLLDILRNISQDEIDGRLRYLRTVAPLLAYYADERADERGAGGEPVDDAAQLLIEQLEQRLGRLRGHS